MKVITGAGEPLDGRLLCLDMRVNTHRIFRLQKGRAQVRG